MNCIEFWHQVQIQCFCRTITGFVSNTKHLMINVHVAAYIYPHPTSQFFFLHHPLTHSHTQTHTNTHKHSKLQTSTHSNQTNQQHSINMSYRSTNQSSRGMTVRESSPGMSRDDRSSRHTGNSHSHGTRSRGTEMSVYNDSSRLGDHHHELSRRREDSDSDDGHGHSYATGTTGDDPVWSTMRAMGIKPEVGRSYALNDDGTLSIEAAAPLPRGYDSSGRHERESRHSTSSRYIGHDSHPADHHAGHSRSSRFLEVPSSSRHENRQLAISDGRSSHASSRHGRSTDDRSSHSSSRHGHSIDDRSSHSSSRHGHSIDDRDSRSSRRSTAIGSGGGSSGIRDLFRRR